MTKSIVESDTAPHVWRCPDCNAVLNIGGTWDSFLKIFTPFLIDPIIRCSKCKFACNQIQWNPDTRIIEIIGEVKNRILKRPHSKIEYMLWNRIEGFTGKRMEKYD